MAESVAVREEPMQEISLAENNISNEEKWKEVPTQFKSKSNSLKRFFKMPLRRHGEYTESDNKQGENTIEMEEKDDNEKESQHKEKTHRRFPLRLGGLQRHSGSTNLSRPVKSETGNFNTAPSKTTLKSSLSSYWGLMFKKGKKDKQQSSSSKDEEVAASVEETVNTTDFEAVEKIAESVLNEEVHALKISEDVDAYN